MRLNSARNGFSPFNIWVSHASNEGESGYEPCFKPCSPSLFDSANAFGLIHRKIMRETRHGKVLNKMLC